MAKDPMQEAIERIQRGGEPQRPIDPRLPPPPRASIPVSSRAAVGGIFGGVQGPAQEKALLMRLLDFILRR